MEEFRKRSVEYFLDIPRLVLKPIEGKTKYTRDNVYIHPGSRFLMISYLYSDMCFFNEKSGRKLSTRFLMPPNGQNIEIIIDGKSMLYRGGLNEIGTDQASLTPSCVEYAMQQIAEQGTYSRELHHLVPPTGVQTFNGLSSSIWDGWT